MAGLFGNLPPPSAPKGEDNDKEINQQPSSKRARIENEEPTPAPEMKTAIAETSLPHQKSPPSQPTDQVLAAIHRITSHISNPKKFCKVSELLRQLLSQSNDLRQHHGNAIFSALVASMEEDPTRSNDPLLAIEYSKLFTVASKHPELFSAAQRAQLDVYGLWAVILNQLLTTDDSFTFSKTVNTIKEMMSELPVLEFPEQVEEEEKALKSPYEVINFEIEPIPVTAAVKEDGEVEESLGNENEENIPSRVWSETAVVAYRRAALVSCLKKAGKECYTKAWARTSIDLLIEHASKHAQHGNQHFLPSQCTDIEEMVAFVREQKVARNTKGGKTSGGATAFDKAQSQWNKATLSHRGGVGSGGDHKSEAWLG